MKNHLHIIASILIMAWLVGLLVFAAGGPIHLLFVFAIIAINLIGVRREGEEIESEKPRVIVASKDLV